MPQSELATAWSRLVDLRKQWPEADSLRVRHANLLMRQCRDLGRRLPAERATDQIAFLRNVHKFLDDHRPRQLMPPVR